MANKKTKEVKLSGNAKKIADLLEKMTVLEVSELVKALEDKFGVSAAAPTAVVATQAGSAEEAVEEKTEFDIELTDFGANKISVIKATKNATGVGLKEAKDLVESAPVVIKEALNKEDAEALKKELEEAGAKVVLK